MRILAILAVMTLAACGADGEPERPEPGEDRGIVFGVTGMAEVGIAR